MYHASHYTLVLNSLQAWSYNGIDSILVGNGSVLPIAHTRNLNVETENGVLKLNNTLHVFGLCQKFLSIKCLASNLNAYILIDEFGFFVKEKTVERKIAFGPNFDVLYQKHRPTEVALVGIWASVMVWHHNMGHSSSSVLHHVLSSVPILGSSRSEFCSSRASNKSRHLPFSLRSFTAQMTYCIGSSGHVGLSLVTSRDSCCFLLSIVDDFSHFS